jgi:hypothetical protein
MKLLDACFAAVSGDTEIFKKSLSYPSIDLHSNALLEAVINSQKPKEIMETFIQFKGEPTENDLMIWLNIADHDRCPGAIEAIGDKLFAMMPTQKTLRLLSTIYIKHSPVVGSIWVAKAMRKIQRASL